MLIRKLLREARRQKAQALVLLLVQTLGVALFVACYGGYLDLRESYAGTGEALALAQVHADVRALDDASIRTVAALPGVARAEGRLRVSLPVELPHGRFGAGGRGRVALEVRLVSLPDGGGQPTLDRVHLVSGRLPAAADEVVIERHLAEWHELTPGSTIEVRLADGAPRALRVVGVGVSAEYLWVARSAQDPMSMADSFGVAWMRRDAIVALCAGVLGPLQPAPDTELSAALADRSDELLYDRAPGSDAAAVARAVDAALGAGAVRTQTEASDLVGPRLLQMDIDGMRMMAIAFPIFFLTVSVFISLSALARTVDAQRAIIGTFLALGMRRRRVLAHYALLAVASGTLASLLGAALGTVLARQIVLSYAAELHIPFVTSHPRSPLIAAALAAGMLSALIAGIVPAWRAARLAPAEAMRPPQPSAGPLVRASRRLSSLPLAVRMPLRNVLRHPIRSLTTACGVAAAVLLVVATASVAVSTQRVADVQMLDAQRYDLRLDLAVLQPTDGLRAELMALPGVHDVELSLTLPVQVSANGVRRALVLSAISPESALLRPVDWAGQALRPAAGTILLPRGEARRLQVGAGDEVAVDAGDGRSIRLKVGPIVDTAMGPVASMDLGEARRSFALGSVANTAALTASETVEIRNALMALPGAIGLSDAAGLRAQLGMLLGLNLAMVGMMLGFAGVLGAAILYNTATLGILERARELATLRALGMSMRKIAAQSTVENALLGAAGLAIGLAAGHPLSRWLVARFDTDLISMPFVWSWPSVVASGALLVALLLAAQLPALRTVSRMDLAAAVRSREG